MKRIAFLAIAAVFSGCSGVSDRMVQYASGPTLTDEVAVDPAAPKMLAQMMAHGSAGMFSYVGERQGVQIWRAADGIELYLQQGIVIGTRGIGDDLMSLDHGQLLAALRSGQPREITKTYRRLNGEGVLAKDSYRCVLGPDITPPPAGTVVTGPAIAETCTGPQGQFRNRYWVKGGRIVQSEQYLTPKAGLIRL